MRWSIWLAVVFAIPLAAGAQGQLLPIDPVDSLGHRVSAAPLGAPGELLVDVQIDSVFRRDAIAPDDFSYLPSVLQDQTRARAQAWLDSLGRQSVKGFQLNAYGRLAIVGDRVALAKQQLQARLSTPELSTDDRAYTLYVGATAFADVQHPEWLSTSEQYLTQLVGLGDVASRRWQFLAREHLVTIYYELGRRSEALAQGDRAYALLPDLPFEDRVAALSDQSLYFTMADILLGMPGTPNGIMKLQALDSLLLTFSRVSADRLAIEPRLAWFEKSLASGIHQWSNLVTELGQTAPPVIGNLWINTPDTAMTRWRLDDGRIYILDFFRPDLVPLLPVQMQLVHLQARLGPKVQFIGVAELTGHWGEQLVEPQDEAQRWRSFFQETLKLSFPVALWVKTKYRTVDGGYLPPEDPNFLAYHLVVAGRFPGGVLVIDQHDRVRRIFSSDVDHSAEIERLVTALLADTASHGSP